MSRRIRFLAAVFAIVSLAMAQLALSSYRCPMGHEGMARSVSPEGDAQLARVCAQHCEQAGGMASASKQASAIGSPSTAALRIEPLPATATAAKIVLRRASPAARPPPANRFAVLRI